MERNVLTVNTFIAYLQELVENNPTTGEMQILVNSSEYTTHPSYLEVAKNVKCYNEHNNEEYEYDVAVLIN